MDKLSKQDKIEIFNLRQNYQVGTTELSRHYQVNPSTINYILALINRHGTAILDRPHTSYSVAFEKQAIRQVLVKNEAIYQVALDLGLKNKRILANWLREYRKNGYYIFNKQRGRLPHDQKRAADQARNQALTSAELKAENRERICKKIERLSRPADQEPQASEIAQAVTQLRHELNVSITFILNTINAKPNLSQLSRSNYYSLKKSSKDYAMKP